MRRWSFLTETQVCQKAACETSERPAYRKNAFDAGEEGLGFNANSLKLGCDCVGEVRYLDAVVSDAAGEPEVIENAICIHEEDVGVFWKHTNWRTASRFRPLLETDLSATWHVREGCRSPSFARWQTTITVRSLVVLISKDSIGISTKTAPSRWRFAAESPQLLQVKMTGILNTSPLSPGDRNPTYGVVMRPGLGAPIHQHFFNVRLDMCVDGPRNIVQEVNVEQSRGEGASVGQSSQRGTTCRRTPSGRRLRPFSRRAKPKGRLRRGRPAIGESSTRAPRISTTNRWPTGLCQVRGDDANSQVRTLGRLPRWMPLS